MPVLHQDMVDNLDEDFDGSLTDDNKHTTGQVRVNYNNRQSAQINIREAKLDSLHKYMKVKVKSAIV